MRGGQRLTGRFHDAKNSMLSRHIRYHAWHTKVRLRRAEQDDGSSAEAACTITAGEREGFLLGHSTCDSFDEIHSALDVDIDHLGEQVGVEKRRERLELFQIDLQSPMVNKHETLLASMILTPALLTA